MSIFIIAELGINHNGDIKIAKDLIKVAKDTSCDAVKFQKRTIDLVYTKEFLDSPRESPWGKTQRAQKGGLEFGLKEYKEIDRYCKEIGIEWFASAWDLESQKFLKQFDCKYNKIASAMLVYEDLLKEVASEKKHAFVSTGMSDIKIIDYVICFFFSFLYYFFAHLLDLVFLGQFLSLGFFSFALNRICDSQCLSFWLSRF